jgi:phosphoadenosine phosphosulfate reductase
MTRVAARRWGALRSLLADIARRHPGAALASSLSAEDMVLTHAIFLANLPLRIFTLDTGCLHAETLALLARIESDLGRTVEIHRPDARAVADYVAAHGAHAFYDSVDLRKTCCRIRKVEPLKRALFGCPAWITGQRRDQAATRGELPEEEYDAVFGLVKYNPLAAWSEEEVWEVVRTQGIPYNPLHDRGYPSIGCEPCTRAVRPGEDARSGRWWWESSDAKECGLHAGNSSPASSGRLRERP